MGYPSSVRKSSLSSAAVRTPRRSTWRERTTCLFISSPTNNLPRAPHLTKPWLAPLIVTRPT